MGENNVFFSSWTTSSSTTTTTRSGGRRNPWLKTRRRASFHSRAGMGFEIFKKVFWEKVFFYFFRDINPAIAFGRRWYCFAVRDRSVGRTFPPSDSPPPPLIYFIPYTVSCSPLFPECCGQKRRKREESLYGLRSPFMYYLRKYGKNTSLFLLVEKMDVRIFCPIEEIINCISVNDNVPSGCLFVCLFLGSLVSKDGRSVSEFLCLHPLSIQNVL